MINVYWDCKTISACSASRDIQFFFWVICTTCVSQSDQISGRAPFCLQEELRTKIVPVAEMQRRSCFLDYFLCGDDIKLRGALLRARIRHEFVCLSFRLWYPRTQICFTSVSRGVGDICTSASVCSLQHDDTPLMSVQMMTHCLRRDIF